MGLCERKRVENMFNFTGGLQGPGKFECEKGTYGVEKETRKRGSFGKRERERER